MIVFIDSIINEIKTEMSDKSDSIEENEDLIENEKNNKIIKMTNIIILLIII